MGRAERGRVGLKEDGRGVGGVSGLHKAGLSQFKMDLMAHGTAQLQLQSLHLPLSTPLSLSLSRHGV